ncbi:MAG TPA: hypothetical protein VHO06_26625 [Polyangia bacterium]|nr:hypothetical protein [Polyangia bacterium]
MANPEAFSVRGLPHEEGLRRALEFAAGRAHQRGTGIGIAVHQKSNLDGIIAGLLGDAAVKALKKHGTVNLSGVQIDLITLRSAPARFSGPVIAAWAEKSLLDRVSEISGATDVIALPWGPHDAGLEAWMAAHQATDILSGQNAAGPDVDPVVQEGLKVLSSMVNVSTGVSHPSDRALAIEIFRLLRGAGRSIDPASVRAWLLAQEWKPSHADAVSDIVVGVLEGRRFRDAREVLRSGIIEQWIKAAGDTEATR